MTNKVCVVTGVGPATGAAVTRRFAADGYAVAMLAWNHERLATRERESANPQVYPCNERDNTERTNL